MDIPLNTAKKMIIGALSDFDHDLGRRATDILGDPLRANIKQPADPPNDMMMCRPAGITEQDLRRLEMYSEPEDFAARFAPDFTEQENSNDYAIIDFEYHGTPESVKYLAHELGHCMADDMQREQGRSFRDFEPQQMEEQAYFIQKIVTASIARNDTAHDVVRDDFNRISSADSEERQAQQNNANAAYIKACNMGANQRRAFIAMKMGAIDDFPEVLSAPVISEVKNTI